MKWCQASVRDGVGAEEMFSEISMSKTLGMAASGENIWTAFCG